MDSATSGENTADAPTGKRRAKVGTVLRFGISFVLLAVVYTAVDLNGLLNTLSELSVTAIVGVALLYALGQFISSVKWRIFMNTVGIHRSLDETVRAYFFGMFVNTFGLGTVGGDVARSLAIRPERGKRAGALATVVADRVHGLMTLATIGAVAILLVQPEVFGYWVEPSALIVVLGLLTLWVFGPRLLVKVFASSKKFSDSAKTAANAFPREGKPLLIATVISLAFHCLQIYMHFLIARELGANLELSYLFATVPLVNIASALPLSVNGLGIREALYIMLFVPVGVPREVAVAFGAIWIVVVTLVSALGGVLLKPRFEVSRFIRRDELPPSTDESRRERHAAA